MQGRSRHGQTSRTPYGPAGKERPGGFFSGFQNAELINSTGQLFGDRFYVEATYRVTQPNREPQDLTVQIWVSKPGLQPDGRFAFGLIAQALDPAIQAFVDVSNLVFVRSN